MPKTKSKSLRGFVLIELASFSSVISGSMLYLAFPWLALELTGNAVSSGALVALSSIPGLLLAPLIGAIIDRLGRKLVSVVGDALATLSVLLIPLIENTLGLTYWLLVVAAMIRAIVAPGGQAARKSLIPDVARDGGITLERANSIHEAIFAAGFAIGPAIAGGLIVWVGAINSFYFAGVFVALASMFAALIRNKEDRGEHEAENRTNNIFTDMKLGVRAILNLPPLMVLFISIVIVALVYLPTEMVVLPTYYQGINEPTGLAILLSVMGASSVLSALGYEWLDKFLGKANLFRIGMLSIALAMLPMSFLPEQWVMLAAGAVLGFTWGPMMPLLNTVIQDRVDPAVRGRVFGIEMAIWNAVPLLTMVAAGLAVDAFGVQPVYMTLAGMVLIFSFAISVLPTTKRLNY